MSYNADVSHPAALRRKLNSTISDDNPAGNDVHDSQLFNVHRCITDEVDLEVALRERLATIIEGRVEWALQVLDALSNAKELEDEHIDRDDFQDAALDALDALEAPLSFVFDTTFPKERSPSPSISPTVASQPAFHRVPKTRSTRTPKPSQQKKHLYIKLPPSQLALLACPTCGRTQFTTLQGLLNHARLAHGIEWASHDACITACAVPISADTQNWETCEGDGVEVHWGGNVVGLRRLFERAVGVDDALPSPALAYAAADVPSEGSKAAPSTLLSHTLGLHADSPALAQFLGRQPKRRCIHVHDEEQFVDIMIPDDTAPRLDGIAFGKMPQVNKGFCMRYPHRNTTREDPDVVVETDTTAEISNADKRSVHANIPAGTTTSRFHMTARIRLEDRSLFLKEDRRTQLGTSDQYRWMLGVTAASYSLPLSSFLTSMTVVPPRTVSPVLLTVQQQPFAVVGTANEPFMAKVILEWVGTGKMELEHWVELDQSKSFNSVFGSEQLLDVELDRNIRLLPAPKGSSPPLPSLDDGLRCDFRYSTTKANVQRGDSSISQEEYYEQVLRGLLPRVPITAKDVKQRATIQVPYMLVTSPAHLLTLVPGRRKAIEWGCARALHALYVDHMALVSPCRRTTLTVGDVYMFLEDGSHFPRPQNPTLGSPAEPRKRGREKDGTPILGEESCSTCGIKKGLHPGFDVKNEGAAVHWTCGVVPALEQRYGARLPLVNLAQFLAFPDGLGQAKRSPLMLMASSAPNQRLTRFLLPLAYPLTPRDLVTLSPPDLIFAVHKIMSRLRLFSFAGNVTIYGENPAYLTPGPTERCLAPAALLTLSLKPFISTLLRAALEIAKRDATSITPTTKNGRGKRVKKLTFVLSAGHILRGLRLQTSNSNQATPGIPRNAMDCAKESVALCVARLGVQLSASEPALGSKNAESLIGQAKVKAEPE